MNLPSVDLDDARLRAYLRLIGQRGGRARIAKMSEDEIREACRKASRARWAGHKPKRRRKPLRDKEQQI